MELRVKCSISHADILHRRNAYKEADEGKKKLERMMSLGFKPGLDFTVGAIKVDHRGVRYWPYTFKDRNKYMMAKLAFFD